MLHLRIRVADNRDLDYLSKILESINVETKLIYDNKSIGFLDLYLPTTSETEYRVTLELSDQDGIEVIK